MMRTTVLRRRLPSAISSRIAIVRSKHAASGDAAKGTIGFAGLGNMGAFMVRNGGSLYVSMSLTDAHIAYIKFYDRQGTFSSTDIA